MAAREHCNIYVISLASAQLRRDFMRAQLDGPLTPDWRFVEAIPKAEIDSQWIAGRAAGRRYASGELTVSEHACRASHLEALQTIVDNGDETAIILEDDATLAESFPEIVRALTRTIDPQSAVVVVLHWTPLYYGIGRKKLLKGAHLCATYAGHGAQGYLVTRESARRLLRIHDEILINPDDWSYFIENYRLDVRCVVPYCVSHGLVGRSSQLVHRHMQTTRRRGVERMKSWFGAKWREKFIRRPLSFVRRQPRIF